MKKLLVVLATFTFLFACKEEKVKPQEEKLSLNDSIPEVKKESPFLWEGANIYFMLTDRFNNGLRNCSIARISRRRYCRYYRKN